MTFKKHMQSLAVTNFETIYLQNNAQYWPEMCVMIYNKPMSKKGFCDSS